VSASDRLRRALLLAAPFLVGLAVLYGMLLMALRRDPYVVDEARRGYHQNWPGDVSHELTFGVAELVVLALILRPWSYRRSWGRALFALAIFIPWTLFFAIVGIHAGSVNGAHLFWLVGVVLFLLLQLGISSAEALRLRRRSS
jgi:hypothetical protein